MTEIKAGMKLNSTVSDAQIMVLIIPKKKIMIQCGGYPMQIDKVTIKQEFDPEFLGDILTGKRYINETETIEILCTQGGEGLLSYDGETLSVKVAKRLPSSD